jgi:hypothetical protein
MRRAACDVDRRSTPPFSRAGRSDAPEGVVGATANDERMLRALPIAVILAAGGAAAAGLPSPAAAASCSDFQNQAAAQRAANTRDADGDGVYCESLPCPCSHAKGAPAPTKPTGGASHRLGRTIRLGPVHHPSSCRLRGPLPDPGCTPGTRYALVDRRDVCTPGYSSRVRNVRDGTRAAVYAAYGVRSSFDGQDGELDHLVSLELGGTNARANLFPEAATPFPGAGEKDRLENELHSRVCSGALRLRSAQRLIARDWVAAYRRIYGSS